MAPLTAAMTSGRRAQLQGTGRLNGRAGYRFVLGADDGHGRHGAGQDRPGLRVTHTDAESGAKVVDYDNRAPVTARASDAPGRTVVVAGGVRLRD